MPRRKKKPEEILNQLEAELDISENEPSDEEPTEENIEMQAAEDEPAEASDESTEPSAEQEASKADESEEQEDATEVTAEAEEKEAVKPRVPRRRRSPRKKTAETETPQVAAVTSLPESLREDMAITSAGVRQTMDTMAKQWQSVKEITNSVVTNLERINQLLKEVPPQQFTKPAVIKPALLTKIAAGMGAFALVMSVISITLSQSAREKALERTAQQPIGVSENVAGIPSSGQRSGAPHLAPSSVSPELATRPSATSVSGRRRAVVPEQKRR